MWAAVPRKAADSGSNGGEGEKDGPRRSPTLIDRDLLGALLSRLLSGPKKYPCYGARAHHATGDATLAGSLAAAIAAAAAAVDDDNDHDDDELPHGK